MSDNLVRCGWAKNELSLAYHDAEWGVPVHDDRILFEFLILEGAQAGLSWDTILRKRAHYRLVFDNFDAEKIARYDAAKTAALLADAGIVRNRLKIAAAITNAQKYLDVQAEFGSFDAYLWRFVGGRPIVSEWRELAQVPARTPESDAMSKDLQKRGFKFVGSTICYAFMQATGLVNDHLTSCFRHAEFMNKRKADSLQINYEDFFAVLKAWDPYTYVNLDEIGKGWSAIDANLEYGGNPPHIPLAKTVKLSNLAILIWHSMELGAKSVDEIHADAFVLKQVALFTNLYGSVGQILSHIEKYNSPSAWHEDFLEPSEFFLKLEKTAQIKIVQQGYLQTAIKNYAAATRLITEGRNK